jgi:ribosomal protein S3|tara:strand:+ start:5523 stop:6491 length:969 start_codon:yes stop_codon:yes gene_type:complete
MGQKVHSTGFRLGVSQGWDSSWSSGSIPTAHNYRQNLHMDLEIRNLITQLFASKEGYVGKLGISKSSSTNIVDINVYGYVPGGAPQQKRDAVNKVPVTYKKGLETQLGRLVDVLNEKYSPEVFALNCVLVTGVFFRRTKKKTAWNMKRRNKKRSFGKRMLSGSRIKGSKVILKINSARKKINKKSSKSDMGNNPRWAFTRFKFLARQNYFESLINIAFLVVKTKQPQFLASFIARELGKTRFQRALVNNTSTVCSVLFKEMPGLQGIRIQVSGRMNKTKRTRKYVAQYGRIPSQTVVRPVQYGFDEAHTLYGSMGVKVWLAY